jgi:hypothetical protein
MIVGAAASVLAAAGIAVFYVQRADAATERDRPCDAWWPRTDRRTG